MMKLDEFFSTPDETCVHFPDVDEEDRIDAEYAILARSDERSAVADPRPSAFSYGLGPRADALVDVVLLVEDVMRRPVEEVSPDDAAELATMCVYPSLVQAVALQIAFGRETGVEHRRKWLSLIAEAKISEMSVDDYVIGPLAFRELNGDRIDRLFRGIERQCPLRDRVVHGIAVLRRIIALLPSEYRSRPLCTLAWLQWANGKRAIAAAYLTESLRLQPDDAVAIVLSIYFDAQMPVWRAA